MDAVVSLDFLEANQIVAALERRLALLERMSDNTRWARLEADPVVESAFLHTELALEKMRHAFHLTERDLDAAHEANDVEMHELEEADRGPIAFGLTSGDLAAIRKRQSPVEPEPYR